MPEKPAIIPIRRVLEHQEEMERDETGSKPVPEARLVRFEEILEHQDREDEEFVRRIRDGIERLEQGKKQYEEWREIALEQRDRRSADLYESKATEMELHILKGEMLCEEADMRHFERWNRHYRHVMETDGELEKRRLLEDIDTELDLVTDLIDSLSGKEGAPETDGKLAELRERRKKLEQERERNM